MTNNTPTFTLMSNGMGVESVALLLRWMNEPETCPCPLEDLIVITSMVGSEWPDTISDFETYMLPRFRRHGIRFVQVARAGHNEADGIVVLDDSREPTKLHGEGAYTLLQELMSAGTVPTFGGEHKCSLKFKAFVIEQWIAANLQGPVNHAFGYNADETTRVEASDNGIAQRNARIEIAFGFNSEEQNRADKGAQYNTPLRRGFYPLVEWGWNREKCLDYIRECLGVEWHKSACSFCPFACNKQNMGELRRRHDLFPEATAEAMALEHASLCVNPRGTLFADKALVQIVGTPRAHEELQKRLDAQEYAVYRVRRIYTAKGKAHRSTERRLDVESRHDAHRVLNTMRLGLGGEIEQSYGIPRLVLRRRSETSWPTREEYLVVAPSTVQDKHGRFGREWFDANWNGTHRPKRRSRKVAA